MCVCLHYFSTVKCSLNDKRLRTWNQSIISCENTLTILARFCAICERLAISACRFFSASSSALRFASSCSAKICWTVLPLVAPEKPGFNFTLKWNIWKIKILSKVMKTWVWRCSPFHIRMISLIFIWPWIGVYKWGWGSLLELKVQSVGNGKYSSCHPGLRNAKMKDPPTIHSWSAKKSSYYWRLSNTASGWKKALKCKQRDLSPTPLLSFGEDCFFFFFACSCFSTQYGEGSYFLHFGAMGRNRVSKAMGRRSF